MGFFPSVGHAPSVERDALAQCHCRAQPASQTGPSAARCWVPPVCGCVAGANHLRCSLPIDGGIRGGRGATNGPRAIREYRLKLSIHDTIAAVKKQRLAGAPGCWAHNVIRSGATRVLGGSKPLETLTEETSVPEILAWHWLAFAVLVAVLLAADLFVFNRHEHTPTLWESTAWTIVWIAVGLGFNGVLWVWGVWEGGGSDLGLAFLSAYLIEKSLSMDNIFVFVVIFRFFGIPIMYQYRVLHWGIIGAVIMRLVFILVGVELLHRFDWVAPVFGAFLVYTAYKLARHSGAKVHPEKNILLRMARRLFPVSQGDHRQHGSHFLVREQGRWCVTPMLLVLLVVESTDVVFAVDSVPAVIGIVPAVFPPGLTKFVAFTSNVFAILGLRALYFLLAGMVEMFRFLHFGLAGVLGFVGLKMIGQWWLADGGTHLVPTWVSLVVIAGLLGASMLVSVLWRPQAEPAAAEPAASEDEARA